LWRPHSIEELTQAIDRLLKVERAVVRNVVKPPRNLQLRVQLRQRTECSDNVTQIPSRCSDRLSFSNIRRDGYGRAPHL
jgi:hypothetical protein